MVEVGSTTRHYVFDPLPIRYDGLDADRHEIELYLFGESARGLARIISVLAHFSVTQRYTKQMDALEVRVVATIPEPRCFQFWAAVQAVAQHPLIVSAAGGLFGILITYAFSRLAGRREEMKHLRGIAEALIRELGHREPKQLDRLLTTVDRMIEALRPAARHAVAPIGRTCNTLTAGDPDRDHITLGVVDKEAIEAGPDAEVIDEREFSVVITELDMATGSCRVSLTDDSERRYRGQIVDPQVLMPRNPYVLAMGDQTPLLVRAKALVEDGVVRKLFISDSVRRGP